MLVLILKSHRSQLHKAAKAAAAQDAPGLSVSIAPRTSQHDQAVSVGLSVEQVRVLSVG